MSCFNAVLQVNIDCTKIGVIVYLQEILQTDTEKFFKEIHSLLA